MSDHSGSQKQDRPALPRDSFRSQRIPGAGSVAPGKPVVVTPDYGDPVKPSAPPEPTSGLPRAVTAGGGPSPSRRRRPETNPFEAYGERSSSRPYALRLPDAIDLVLRQMAAEERTHPLRVIDRILHDHLKRIGRLPPVT